LSRSARGSAIESARVLAEAGEVLLVPAPGRGDDDAVLAREPVEERAAGRGAVEHRDRPLDRPEPFAQLEVRHVRPAQVELGLAPVERPVPDQDDPERFAAGRGRLLGQGRSQSLAIVAAGLLGQADPDHFGRGLRGGGLPLAGPAAELRLILGRPRGADDDHDARPILGPPGRRHAQADREQCLHSF